MFSKYGLGLPIDNLQKPLSKTKWKNIVKKEIHKHFLRLLLAEAGTKSTLKKVIFCEDFLKPHSVWNIYETDTMSVRKTCIKAKLLVGIYMLQTTKVKYKKYKDNTCPLCLCEQEDFHHFLLLCTDTLHIHSKHFLKLVNCIPSPRSLRDYSYNILTKNVTNC